MGARNVAFPLWGCLLTLTNADSELTNADSLFANQLSLVADADGTLSLAEP
jgi:hypothetical protein